MSGISFQFVAGKSVNAFIEFVFAQFTHDVAFDYLESERPLIVGDFVIVDGEGRLRVERLLIE